jgi:hypothetical protein
MVAVSDVDGLTADPITADELGNQILKIVLPAVNHQQRTGYDKPRFLP